MIETLVCVALAAALFVRLFLCAPITVKGRSMESTLHSGDLVAVDERRGKKHRPGRGDIVICHYPGRRSKRFPFLKTLFIKRLIGLPGETIEIVDSKVMIGGRELPEPYLDPARTRLQRQMPPRTLGPDEYFVMGDNRDNSNDSRSVGPITGRMLRGRVLRRLCHLTLMERLWRFHPRRRKRRPTPANRS